MKKVSAYQYTLGPASVGACNITLFDSWKNATGFDEAAYLGGWVGGWEWEWAGRAGGFG